MSKVGHIIALILVLLVSACAAQTQRQPANAVQPEAQSADKTAEQPQSQPAKTEVVTEPAVEAPQEAAKPKSAEVRLLKKSIEPLELIISAGTLVTWVNDGGVSTILNINKDNKFFMRSNLLKNGDKFEQELKEKGAYVFWGEAYGVQGRINVK